MAETENKGKATMIQFAARPRKNNFIAAEPGETKETTETKDIPTKDTKQEGINTLEIGQYFKVKNREPWKYYLKTSNNKSVNLQSKFTKSKTNEKEQWRQKLEKAKNTTNVKNRARDGSDDTTLKEGDYFKVAKGDEYKYYQKNSAKGARLTTLETFFAKTTTKDYMKGDITADSVKKHIQVQDMVAVDKNTKFSVLQLVNTSRIFRNLGSLVKLSWVNSIIAYKRLRLDLEYHERVDIREFIQIFDNIKITIDKTSGILSTPGKRHVATLKFQERIEFGESVIHMNNLKIALYNLLMRKTRKKRGEKLKAIQEKKEGLLLLVIACSIGLPTRKFTNAYGFFEIFAKKHTIVNDSNIIRTLLNLNGIYVDEVREYGNRALELWEIYKKEFPHFKSIDDDNNDIKTLYSYPTATELRYLVRRAKEVITNILGTIGNGNLSSAKPLNLLMSI
jgi:hypothetical protein